MPSFQPDILFNANQSLDLYLCDQPHQPLVVCVHGGGFHSGSRQDKRCQQLGEYLSENGINVAAMSYVLAPREDRFSKWPQTIYDVADSISFLAENQERWGFDSSRLGLVGFSAGCCLANLYMLGGARLYKRLGYETSVITPKALVGFYGPYDFSIRDPAKQPKDPEVNKLHSPAYWFSTYEGDAAPPVYHVHGDADQVVNLAQHYAFKKEYTARGFSFQGRVIPGFPHTFAPVGEGPDGKVEDLRPELLAFYQAHL